MQSNNHRVNILTLVLFYAFCAYSIARFLSILQLNPDSTGYITAAQNFIRTGHMFAYANSPSWSLLPAIEPYTEQPSGFPLFLVPFLLIFKQPVMAAAVAQSCAILIFYSAVLAITYDLGARPIFQLFSALLFTLFRPMLQIFASVESETLFIALSLWTIHFLIASKFSRRAGQFWIAALSCAAYASLTRAVGVLMVGVFVWVSWHRPKSRWISIFWSILFVIGPMVAWSLRNRILYGALSSTHTLNDHIAWEKLFPQLVYLLDSISRNALVIVLFVAFTLLCLAMPFIGPTNLGTRSIRFKWDFSQVHFYSILFTLIGLAMAVISLAADRLGFGGDPEIGLKQVFFAGLGILIAAIPWIRNTNSLEYVRSWKAGYDWERWTLKPLYTFSLLLGAGLSHFVGITALSLVTPFSNLRDRLLSPSLAILLFSVLAGMHYLITLIPRKHYTIPVYGVALALMILSPFFITSGLPFQIRVNIPPEQELWKEIDHLPGINKASHFYSDNNFTHEIFGNRPQRIILVEDQLEQKGFLSGLMSTGQCPFVIVNTGDRMSQLMGQYYKEANLTRLEMLNGQFELYAQPCLLSP
ncbi:MAG TPA: hypothetical protein VLD65_03450 [Anaerolineales bacterium]|nr:hypothetical protein [Anaerolineales bacterium]